MVEVGVLVDGAGAGFDEMSGTVERAKVTDLPSAPFGGGGSVETVARRDGYLMRELSARLDLCLLAKKRAPTKPFGLLFVMIEFLEVTSNVGG